MSSMVCQSCGDDAEYMLSNVKRPEWRHAWCLQCAIDDGVSFDLVRFLGSDQNLDLLNRDIADNEWSVRDWKYEIAEREKSIRSTLIRLRQQRSEKARIEGMRR